MKIIFEVAENPCGHAYVRGKGNNAVIVYEITKADMDAVVKEYLKTRGGRR